jgi:hypothetical protein
VNEVGVFDHVPSDAVNVEPSRAVPLIVGGDMFCGTAADALATTTDATAASPKSESNNRLTPLHACVFVIVELPSIRYRRGARQHERNAGSSPV